jgi:hypothetical protein
MSWENQNNDGWTQAPPSPWDNFENVEAKQARNSYIPAGLEGTVRIVELKTVYSKKNNNRPVFVASLAVEECADHEQGIVYDWVAKADENAYLMSIKSLICALNPEADPRSFNRELMETLTGAEQPAKGILIRVRTESIKTQRGNDFTKVHWFPSVQS